MKYIIIIILALIISSCTFENKVPNGYKVHKLFLKNNLCTISIFLPSDFDTTYFWTKTSDNPCGYLEMYRIANKQYSLLKEDGYFYFETPDSLKQLTVFHMKYRRQCEDTTQAIDINFLEQSAKNFSLLHPEEELIIKELNTIHKRVFSVIGFHTNNKNKYNTLVTLSTVINKQIIVFQFKYLGTKSIDFVENVRKSINSIIITTAGNTG